jgi:hypothetical protein
MHARCHSGFAKLLVLLKDKLLITEPIGTQHQGSNKVSAGRKLGSPTKQIVEPIRKDSIAGARNAVGECRKAEIGWLWPAPTESGHAGRDRIKHLHKKAIIKNKARQ